jgi:hypothetical protein
MPLYDLDQAKELVGGNYFHVTERMHHELDNHGYDDRDMAQTLFAVMDINDYYKTAPLHNLNDEVEADIYKVMYYGDEWYVKFFIDLEERYFDEVIVDIWSLHWW